MNIRYEYKFVYVDGMMSAEKVNKEFFENGWEFHEQLKNSALIIIKKRSK